MAPVIVLALYRFVTLDKPAMLRQPLLNLMHSHGIRGTVLLATEGINGTVAGSRAAIDALLAWLRNDPRMAGLVYKESCADEMPFLRSKVKLKKEIVTMGVPGIDPARSAGTYIKPEDWNALIADPDVTLIDTRNDYEVNVGTFRNAVNPKLMSFREFPRFVQDHLNPRQHKKVAMFCTGGIRCEKSTAYLKECGFDEVYHLEGGILKYLEKIPREETQWQGECFVFDERVTVDHELRQGHYEQCNACRMPLTALERQSEHYIRGISCPHCHDQTTAARRRGFAEREKQIQLAKLRGEAHVGAEAADVRERRKAMKRRVKNR